MLVVGLSYHAYSPGAATPVNIHSVTQYQTVNEQKVLLKELHVPRAIAFLRPTNLPHGLFNWLGS
jgi:hypothetical protein